MSVKVRNDSLYKFSSPWFDDQQRRFVWGISDPPDPVKRDDDVFYTIRQEDRIDFIAYKLLGNPRYFWVILHYNGMSNAFDIPRFVGRQIRIPSKGTLERAYLNVSSD